MIFDIIVTHFTIVILTIVIHIFVVKLSTKNDWKMNIAWMSRMSGFFHLGLSFSSFNIYIHELAFGS